MITPSAERPVHAAAAYVEVLARVAFNAREALIAITDRSSSTRETWDTTTENIREVYRTLVIAILKKQEEY